MANRMNPKIFFGELKRRNVYKIAVAYAVASWLLIQIATQVFPFFENSELDRSTGSFAARARLSRRPDFVLGI